MPEMTCLSVIPVTSLHEAVNYLLGTIKIAPATVDRDQIFQALNDFQIDMFDVKGQYQVKRALEVSAAGSHNLLMIGPPGSGKTMLARRVPTILPELSLEEALIRLYRMSLLKIGGGKTLICKN